ncbi:MAG TPA: PAS domain-containing protein [Solirubrobacteraceae bacterium]
MDVSDTQSARRPAARPPASLAATPWERPLISELLESLPDPVIGCDAAGHIVYWGRAAREAYGFSAQEALGERVPELLETTFPRPLLEILEEVTDLGCWQGRLIHRAQDGREVTVESRWVPRYDDGRRLLGWFAIERAYAAAGPLRDGPGAATPDPADPAETGQAGHTDVGEPRPAERLENLGQLAGGVAHDFNNALAIIINYAAFISAEVQRLRSAPTEDQRTALRQDIAEISTAAHRAAELTQQLLAISRQEIGEPAPLPTITSPSAPATGSPPAPP